MDKNIQRLVWGASSRRRAERRDCHMYKAVKRVFDTVLAALGLVILFLPLLVVGLLIRMDSKGKALFKQRRTGLNGKEFYVYKFRTMKTTDVPFDIDNPVIEQDITCQNGYIHVLGDVLVPPSNMADELEKQEDCSLFSSFLDRFTMPVVIGKTAGGDNIYRKVYFAAKGSYNASYEDAGTTGLSVDSAGRDMATLAYDPTWHQNTYSSETYQQNMAAMFVPTDQALDEWWNSSTGQLVMNGKSSWDEVENSLLNVLNHGGKENLRIIRDVMQVLTAVRNQWGMVYPFE